MLDPRIVQELRTIQKRLTDDGTLPPVEAVAGYQDILELHRLHRALDEAIRNAYGWHDLDLEHDFHEVETLPKNERVRYTISPAARKEVLRRLLALNHERAAAQEKDAPAKSKQGQAASAPTANAQPALFD